MKIETNRIMISAPKSGQGKTILTSGLLRVFQKLGLCPTAFKCGPDYIDPMFHRDVFKINGANLDIFLQSENTMKKIFYETAKESKIAVIEGAMGYYDGIGGRTDENSAFQISEILKTPVILTIDVSGSALSVCALINGFLSFRKSNQICGVILNKCSKSLFSVLKPVIFKECGIVALGYIPKDENLVFKSRNLGLIPVSEIGDIKKKIDYIADILEETIDINKILKIAKISDKVDLKETNYFENVNFNFNVAVAEDSSFFFYYSENIEFLRKCGLKISFFSPLNDKELPDNTKMVYIGGGYPELYYRVLSNNHEMLCCLKKFYNNGGFIFAEGSGFSYLQEGFINGDEFFPFCNIIKGKSKLTKSLQNFGYVNLTSNDGMSILKAHEFHYIKSDFQGDSFNAQKPIGNKIRKCIYCEENLFCGFPQIYFYGNYDFIINLLKKIDDKGKKI